MWHRFPRRISSGAAESAAPLLVSGLRLRFHWQGVKIEETGLKGILDTGSTMTCIPLHLARNMHLPSAGKADDLLSFDHSLKLEPYPKFRVELFVPKWGWQLMTVLGCPRKDVLLGLDVCRDMLLLANWRCHGFGMRRAKRAHRPLEILFKRIREVKPD
jgi:hypothetical protein